MSDQFEISQNKVMQKLREKLPHTSIVPVWRLYFSMVFTFFSIIGFFITSILSWVLFTDQVKINSVFASVVGYNFSGWLWLWFPELLFASLALLFFCFLIYRSNDYFGYKYIDWILSVFTFTMILLSVIYLVVPAQASRNLDSIEMIKNIRLSANQSGYRLYWRDKHIQDLKNKQEFYGVISAKNQNIISVDHAGVELGFNCKIENCENTEIGKLIWIRFGVLGGVNEILEYKII